MNQIKYCSRNWMYQKGGYNNCVMMLADERLVEYKVFEWKATTD